MRRDGTLPAPEVAPGAGLKERAAMLAIAASHPVWMVERWVQRYGEAETVKLLAADNRRETQLTMHGWHKCVACSASETDARSKLQEFPQWDVNQKHRPFVQAPHVQCACEQAPSEPCRAAAAPRGQWRGV